MCTEQRTSSTYTMKLCHLAIYVCKPFHIQYLVLYNTPVTARPKNTSLILHLIRSVFRFAGEMGFRWSEIFNQYKEMNRFLATSLLLRFNQDAVGFLCVEYHDSVFGCWWAWWWEREGVWVHCWANNGYRDKTDNRAKDLLIITHRIQLQ